MQVLSDLFWAYGKQVLLGQLFLTVLVVIMVFRYPELVLRLMQRYWVFKSGFKVNHVNLEPGYKVEYMERGNMGNCSASILLLHGFTSSKESFCGFASHFPKRLHVVSPDLPGHGGTSCVEGDHDVEMIVKRIGQFCDAVGLNTRPYHVVGCSLGGLLAGLYARDHQSTLRSLTLMCPAGVKEDQMPLLESIYNKTGRFILLPETDDEFYEMFDILLYKKVKLPSIIVSGIMKERLKSHDFFTKIIKEFEAGTPRTLLAENLEKIKIPTMILWGSHDQVLDISSLDVIREKLPSARIEVIESCGHTIVIERPRRSAHLVTEFVESH